MRQKVTLAVSEIKVVKLLYTKEWISKHIFSNCLHISFIYFFFSTNYVQQLWSQHVHWVHCLVLVFIVITKNSITICWCHLFNCVHRSCVIVWLCLVLNTIYFHDKNYPILNYWWEKIKWNEIKFFLILRTL